MKKALQVYCATLIILSLISSFTARANQRINLLYMEHAINLTPWPSYQKIKALESEAANYDELMYLWWLVRKAQSENLLYFNDDFKQTVKQAIALINTDSPLVIQAQLHLFQGIIYQREGKYYQAQATLAKALSEAKSANLRTLYVFTKQELAYTKTLTEIFDTSLFDIQEAYVEAFALKDQFLIATINETYGAIYGYLNDYKQSIEYYQKALEAYQNLNYPAHIAEAIYGLASTYRYWKKYDLAIEYFEKYQQQIGYTPNANISFFSSYGIGMTLAEKGDCLAAITAIDHALTLQGEVDYNAELYKRKAQCLIKLKRLDEAEGAILKAANIFSGIPELIGTTWQLEVIKISSELANARGLHDTGYKLLQQYHEQYSKLLLENSSNSLLKVRTDMEQERQKVAENLAQKHAEVKILEQEKRDNSERLQGYFNIFIILAMLIVMMVILVQYRSNKKMHLLAIKDSLSGLFNRRYMFEYLHKATSSNDSTKLQLSVILIDIDDFKIINDNFGHPCGDDVIRKIAELGTEVFRQGDIFGRIGGEEFLCILPRTNVTEAKKIAERFLALINKNQMIKLHSHKVTASIGIAALSEQCRDVNQLYIKADQALYKAKHLGKNQIHVG